MEVKMRFWDLLFSIYKYVWNVYSMIRKLIKFLSKQEPAHIIQTNSINSNNM